MVQAKTTSPLPAQKTGREVNPGVTEWFLPDPVAPLITELEIRRRTAQLAREIARDFDREKLVIVAILKGSFMFAADLVRRLYDCNLTPPVDFIRAASYGYGDISSGKISMQLDVSLDLSGREVLLVDDIADSGATLSLLVKRFERKGAEKVKTCVLLDKPARRVVSFTPDYVGFEIPNIFVVGYGLDYAEKFRNIPFIAALERTEAG